MASTQINLRQPVVLDLAAFDAVFDIAQRGRAHDFPPSMPAPIIRRCAGTLAQRCCRDCDPDHLFLPLAGNRSGPASAWANYYATSLTSWKWLPLEHVPIICTRNPHGGSNWRLGGRSVVERMSRWRGRGDEWFVRQAFAEMPSVC